MKKMHDVWTRHAPEPQPLQPGEEWNIFLSYRSVNRSWVINLYDVLVGVGHKVFLDQTVLAAGSKLRRTIGDALEKSQAGVLVWSTAAADSEWVHNEYDVMDNQAERRAFHFVPIRLSDTPLPPFAQNRVYLDFSSYPDGPNGGELLRLLHAVVGKPLSAEAARFAVEQDEAARKAALEIDTALSVGNTRYLIKLVTEGGPSWEASATLGARVAEALTKLDAYDEALEVIGVLEQRFPQSIRPKQLKALALARRGAAGDLEQAQIVVGSLYSAGHRDPETVGIYARTHMDAYAATGNRLMLERSRDLYAEAFEAAQDDYYVGINAASKSVLLGTTADLLQAKEIAERVETIVGTVPVPGDYWKTATIAELALIKQEFTRAAELYCKAVAIAPTELGSHRSTRLQARRLMDAMDASEARRTTIETAFLHLPDD
jgi:hypothetical protein